MKAEIVALPGVQPATMINNEAADELQKVVNHLRSGEAVGVAYVYINEKGLGTTGWNGPTSKGANLLSGVCRLQYEMIKD